MDFNIEVTFPKIICLNSVGGHGKGKVYVNADNIVAFYDIDEACASGSPTETIISSEMGKTNSNCRRDYATRNVFNRNKGNSNGDKN